MSRFRTVHHSSTKLSHTRIDVLNLLVTADASLRGGRLPGDKAMTRSA